MDTQDITKKITFNEQVNSPEDKISENEWTNLTNVTNKVSNQVRNDVKQNDHTKVHNYKLLWKWAFNKILE